MNAVDDGAFDLDAALVLVRVDPRRGCAELHRLLAGEVAAYSRALGVIDVGDHVDEVFDRPREEIEPRRERRDDRPRFGQPHHVLDLDEAQG